MSARLEPKYPIVHHTYAERRSALNSIVPQTNTEHPMRSSHGTCVDCEPMLDSVWPAEDMIKIAAAPAAAAVPPLPPGMSLELKRTVSTKWRREFVKGDIKECGRVDIKSLIVNSD